LAQVPISLDTVSRIHNFNMGLHAAQRMPSMCLLLMAVLVFSASALPSNASNQAMPGAGAERETIAGHSIGRAECKHAPVDQDDLQLGLKLGAQFLVRSQKAAGNFRYEYDWVKQTETNEDNPVRQAGTLWGLTLLHVDEPTRELLLAIRQGLKYFQKHSIEYPGGARLMEYPGQDPQKMGSVALLALAHIEVLRRPEVLESEEEKKTLETHLEGYLKAILAARTSKHNFHMYYHSKHGDHFGPTSAYYDGECLLALVKAAKYLGHDHLWPQIKASAEAGWRKNVVKGLKFGEGEVQPEDEKAGEQAKKRMMGYYQWSNMAWYEAMGTKDPDFSKYASRQLRYSGYILRKSGLSGTGNKGFLFEGIIPAYVTAVQVGDKKAEREFACAIRHGVANLHRLMVGHTKAGDLKEQSNSDNFDDERAQGGAQGSLKSGALRIDTTQHQLHALLMAKRLVQKQALI